VSAGGAPGFLRLACEPPVVRRALLFAVVVGSVLIGINHGDALLAGDLGPVRLLKMGLTVLVPYAVSTLSSVAAIRELRGVGTGPGSN
jgi:hypothetical protein